MSAPGKYTDSQQGPALALYETHGPTAVEKQLGISKYTVASWAKSSGTRTERNEHTSRAVDAKIVDSMPRWQNIASRMYGQAEVTLEDLGAPTFRTIIRVEGGAEHATTLDFIPAGERRVLIQATNTAQELEQRDQDVDQTAAVSVLDRLAKQLLKVDVVDPAAGEQSGISGSSESEAASLPREE